MKLSQCLAIGMLAVGVCAGAAPGAPSVDLKIDFNHTNDITEPGWVGVNNSNRLDNGTEVDLGGGVTAGCTGWNIMTSRDRGVPNPGLPPFNQDLLRDFLQPSTSTPGTVVFEVRGLAAGTYGVTLIDGDPSYPGETGDTILLNGNVVNIPDWPSDPSTATFDDFCVTVAVTLATDEPISLGWTGAGSYGKLAGMTIVPEPATLGLLALGGLVGLIRSRRRA